MISVIIPTLNEEKTLGNLLGDLKSNDLVTEVIVVDGGSDDETTSVAELNGAGFYRSERGRANQMNFGAAKAKNQILLFLHADSRISAAALGLIPTQLEQVDAGSFYLGFDSDNYLLKVYSIFSKMNLSIFTYGDQGLFMRKTFFEQLNGFKSIPIMEDIDIIQRTKRLGVFKKARLPVISSARRFRKNGILFQQMKNIALVTLYQLGVSPRFLSGFYRY